MSTASVMTGDRLVIGGVSWKTYERILRAFDDRHLRITYDRGALEIMTLSPEHERLKHLVALLVAALVEELDWNMSGYGSMTFKRRKRRRGLEPDECFWIQNEPAVRCKDHIDIRRDPPPDLVLEVEVTKSALDRLSIYGVLGVPEVWRITSEDIRVLVRNEAGQFEEATQSRAFPFLPMAELFRFLGLRTSCSETDMVRRFRTWVREHIAAGWAS